MTEPGLDLHEWATRWSELEESAAEDAAGSLPEMDRLLEEMLTERGIQLDEPVTEEGDDPDLVRQFLAAREVTRLAEAGDVDPGDVGAAIEGYRALYELFSTEHPAP
jgi:hypothetical protein